MSAAVYHVTLILSPSTSSTFGSAPPFSSTRLTMKLNSAEFSLAASTTRYHVRKAATAEATYNE